MPRIMAQACGLVKNKTLNRLALARAKIKISKVSPIKAIKGLVKSGRVIKLLSAER
jgi:hypothetical protein